MSLKSICTLFQLSNQPKPMYWQLFRLIANKTNFCNNINRIKKKSHVFCYFSSFSSFFCLIEQWPFFLDNERQEQFAFDFTAFVDVSCKRNTLSDTLQRNRRDYGNFQIRFLQSQISIKAKTLLIDWAVFGKFFAHWIQSKRIKCMVIKSFS